jgi:ankyrin repeat protein
MTAAHAGHYNVVKRLIDLKCDASAICKETGRNALHQIAFNGHHDLVELLVENGCDPNRNAGSMTGRISVKNCTPLHLALKCSLHKEPLLEKLILAGSKLDSEASQDIGWLEKKQLNKVLNNITFKRDLTREALHLLKFGDSFEQTVLTFLFPSLQAQRSRAIF